MARSLTCEEVVQFVMQYLERELSGDVQADFEVHLRRCTACVAYIDSYEKTVALGKTAFPNLDESLEDVPDELVNAILSAARNLSPR